MVLSDPINFRSNEKVAPANSDRNHLISLKEIMRNIIYLNNTNFWDQVPSITSAGLKKAIHHSKEIGHNQF